MPSLHVCSLSRLEETVQKTGAQHLVTLLTESHAFTRPAALNPENHLRLGFNDISEPRAGYVMPRLYHVEKLLAFAQAWPREKPLLIHCWAGISRSTAAAYIVSCAFFPERIEASLAQALREASPSATPNRRLIELGDELLGRKGRMIEAVQAIGRGCEAFEGEPFQMW